MIVLRVIIDDVALCCRMCSNGSCLLVAWIPRQPLDS